MSWDDEDAPDTWEDFDESNIVLPTQNKKDDDEGGSWEDFDESNIVIPAKEDTPKVSWDEEEEEEDTPTPVPVEKAKVDTKPKEKKKTGGKKKPKNKSKAVATQNKVESSDDEDPHEKKMRLAKLVQEMDFENAREMFGGLSVEEPPIKKEEEELKKEEPKKEVTEKAKEFTPKKTQATDDYDDDEEDYETVPKSKPEAPKYQAPKKAKNVVQADINIDETVADLVKKIKPLYANPQFFRCYKSLIQSATKNLSGEDMKEISKIFTNVSNAKLSQQSDKKKKAAKPVRKQLNMKEEEDGNFDEMF